MLRVNADDIDITDDHLYTWKGEPFCGIGFELDSEGRLISELQFHNGMKQGTTRGYFPSGKLLSEIEYRHNTVHGFLRDWNEDGEMVREVEYEHGVTIRRKTPNAAGELVVEYELTEDNPQHRILQLLRKSERADPLE